MALVRYIVLCFFNNFIKQSAIIQHEEKLSILQTSTGTNSQGG